MWYTVQITVLAHDERDEETSKRKGGSGTAMSFNSPLYPKCYNWEAIVNALATQAEEEYEKVE